VKKPRGEEATEGKNILIGFTRAQTLGGKRKRGKMTSSPSDEERLRTGSEEKGTNAIAGEMQRKEDGVKIGLAQ